MAKKMRVSPESVLESFFPSSKSNEIFNPQITTSQISDAIKNLAGNSGVISGVKPIKDNWKILGKVVTARTRAEDWGTVLKALDQAKAGEILFLQAESDHNAIWGELTSISAETKGLQGTVVFGATRDVKAIKEMNYPVFSRAIVPNAGHPLGEGQVNIPLNCSGITINPGDIVAADECGVVVIDQKIFLKVIKIANEILKEEDELADLLKDGKKLSELIGLN